MSRIGVRFPTAAEGLLHDRLWGLGNLHFSAFRELFPGDEAGGS
jgi:hypothetical protein